ncbi:MAG: HIT domain-containing protein, partial [Jatrophihabitantaceae bacterium]
MSENCLFCSIIAGDVPATKVWEDDDALAFADINPQAPFHVLVIPKIHVANIVESAADSSIGSAVLQGIRAVTAQEGITDFRTVFNTGAGAQQTVFHVHAHVLAGR